MFGTCSLLLSKWQNAQLDETDRSECISVAAQRLTCVQKLVYGCVHDLGIDVTSRQLLCTTVPCRLLHTCSLRGS